MENVPPPKDRPMPASPDEVGGGLRGPILGVRRFGGRAMGLAAGIGFVLFCGIAYGLGHTNSGKVATTDAATAPSVAPSNASHFGQNEAIVATPTPAVTSNRRVAYSVPNLQPAGPTPSPAVQQGDNGALDAAQQRMQQLLQQKADEERARREEIENAIKSPIIVNPNGLSNVGASVVRFASDTAEHQGASLDGSTEQNGTGSDHAADGILPSQREGPATRYEIIASSVIPVTLISGIDSDRPGLITALVRENVYDSLTGHYLLIPQGSRLLGSYESAVKNGQDRLTIAWRRVIFPDTSSIDLLNMVGADIQGGAGFGGTVDNHTGKLVQAVLLSSVLAIGAAETSQQDVSIVQIPSVGRTATQAAGLQIQNAGSQIVQRYASIPPTIHVPRGYPCNVIVDRDISFRAPYSPQI